MSDGINYNFNKKQCIRSLKRIGFINNSKRSKHFKFYPPDHIKDRILSGNPQFIMIPNHNELRIQKLIITELRKMGGEDLVNIFVDNL